jgi:SAM-dependent methyltransferase
VGIPDWTTWHSGYDEPGSGLSRRLALITERIEDVFRARAGTRTRVVSACAGEGRDVIGAAARAPDPDAIEACLLERTPEVAAAARASARRHALQRFTVLEADAGEADVYAPFVPADLLLFCGVFGWISDEDVFRTVDALPMLASPGATVIWTRHRRAPDATGAIRARFATAGFREIAFEKLPNAVSSIGVHRLAGPALPFARGMRLFTLPAEPSA